MKTTTFRAGMLAVISAMDLPCQAFEIHTEELISHSILARLIVEAPFSRTATRHKKSGMAFLADKAVEPQVAFLIDKGSHDEDPLLSSEAQVKKESSQESHTGSDPTSQVRGEHTHV